MVIKYGKQIDINSISEKEISLFLFAGNHEKRVFTAYDKIIKNNTISKSILFVYKDSYKVKHDHSSIEKIKLQNHQEISTILDQELGVDSKKDLCIIVDYSCMTKSWYYTIILYLRKKELDFNSITVYFIYTPSKFTKPLEPKPNTEIAPLPGKYIVPTDKPKALIVCLGYEQRKAEGIIEHLDPKEYYIIYSKPALDYKFVKKIEENNSTLLDRTDKKKIITFQLDDMLSLERELTSLYYLLREEYSIIIAPLGPKPFTFISMLMTIKFRDIDIWRVGSGSDINEYTREPIDENTFIISEIVFENSIK
ncbi:hypothetical protein [Mariniflexile maritimum]|uniref:hypothetical protein n=1 Tax=Mariniflexile maritimum TaxID=2682493 RepID=UPI0012F6A1CD|nr:hypothetical protein [Mariniflexile maritimum]